MKKEQETRDPYLRTAIGIIILGIALMLFAALSAQAQTIAGGNVNADEPYQVWVNAYTDSGNEYWLRWEAWEEYEFYNIRIEKNLTTKAIWISECTGDTLAKAYFYGAPKKQKVYGDIFLDGSTYLIGKPAKLPEP